MLNEFLKKIEVKKEDLIGSIRHNRIETFWFNQVPNAGDLVTPFLLKKMGFTPILTDPQRSRVIVCGSLMQRLDENYTNYILGTGFLNEGPSIRLNKAKILAVRGKYTRDRINAPVDTALGDPGLLMAMYLPRREKKKSLIGIVPHYTEKNDPWLRDFLAQNPKEIKLIDIQKRPLDVLRQIDQCQYILSSSLHGLVFADSLLVPNIWISLLNSKSSKIYKFNDYYSAYTDEYQRPYELTPGTKIDHVLTKAQSISEEKLRTITNQLITAFHFLVENELSGQI